MIIRQTTILAALLIADSVSCGTLAQTTCRDCSMAVPDELVKQVSFGVEELKSVSNANCRAYSIDFSDDAQ